MFALYPVQLIKTDFHSYLIANILKYHTALFIIYTFQTYVLLWSTLCILMKKLLNTA